MKKLLIIIFTVSFAGFGFAQQDNSVEYANTITESDMYAHLSVLASDALQGRETGKAGQKMAAAYLAEKFKQLGLKGPVKEGRNFGFYQDVVLYSKQPGDIFLQQGNEKYSNFGDVIYFGGGETDGPQTREIVFAGKGEKTDFAQLDVEGKAVLVLVDGLIAWRNPAQNARENKADMLFVVNTSTDQEFNGLASQLAHFLSGGSLTLAKPGEGDDANEGVFFIKPSTAGKIFNTTIADLKSAKKDLSNVGTTEITYNLEMNVKEVHTENVLGYMEGSDPELKNELVILTAHYDHVGMDGDEIYNGADDDASGTSTILEIAEAFAEAKKAGKGPRRSILFMPVTAEEKGLLGSAYYAENPIFPLEKTVANLNIDMIGRVDPKHKGNPNYVYLVGTDRLSTELHEISEHVNSTYTNLELDYTYNDEGHPDRIYYRSDHWNFAKNDIPIIFYFNGVHEDYHKPTDTIEKINFDILTKRAHLVFYTAWALANRDERPEVDKLKDQKLDTN